MLFNLEEVKGIADDMVSSRREEIIRIGIIGLKRKRWHIYQKYYI
jgi:hypothetical protein